MKEKFHTSRGGFSFGGFLFVLAMGVVVGGVLTYYYLKNQRQSEEALETPAAVIQSGNELGEAREAVEAYIDRKLQEWNLDPDELKDELARGGDIVREKSREIGQNLPGGFSDVKVIATIKAKYTLDRELSGWNIIVGCENGHVTLSGKVDSPEQIGRAVVMALDVDGVADVVSSLKVR